MPPLGVLHEPGAALALASRADNWGTIALLVILALSLPPCACGRPVKS